MSKNEWMAFVERLISDHPADVFGVKAKGEKFVFDLLDTASELRLDYDTTILPPKKFFLPVCEPMLKFDLSKPFEVTSSAVPTPKVIIGVHPYDIAAIKQMDTYFLDTHADASYLDKRKNTLIIGHNVVNVSDKAFFGDMGTGDVDSGYDLMVTDIGEDVVIDIGTEAGEELLGYASDLRDSSDDEAEMAYGIRQGACESATRGLQIGPKGWNDLLSTNYDSQVWQEQADKCLGCGSCTLVCPTCFCYDVFDDLSLNMNTGDRFRTWDGCLLKGFTAVGSGEIFREKIVDRYRHRFNRKGKYIPDSLGFVACVGCGRCSSQCVPDIADPVNLMNALYEASDYDEYADQEADPLTTSIEAADVGSGEELHLPMPATVTRVQMMTETEILLEIQLDSGEPLGHDPGQFVEVSIMGIGEAPISVSSPPGGDTFEIVVRKVGDVTGKLHAMQAGDKLGIRGPFGTGFDIGELQGKNLLFIGGGLGIVPMRSLLNYVLDNREEFEEVTILYGCKEPCELLFGEEVAQWDERDDVQHMLTVDACPEGECWEGEIGVITTIIPKVVFDPENTIAIVVGPPIMYRFVNRDLLNLGMPEENIIVSLERRMKCGVGKCGHCQINGIYVCKEGPVFNYKDIKEHPEAFS